MLTNYIYFFQLKYGIYDEYHVDDDITMRKVMISIRMIAKWSVRDGAFDQKEKYESLFREKEQLHSHSLQVTASTSFSYSLSLSGPEKKFHFPGLRRRNI